MILEYIKVLLLEQNSSDDYQPRILGVIDDVSNRDKLSALLKTTAISLSPYDYDRIRFVFTLIARFEPGDDIAKKACLIVDILELYTRTTPPTMEEFDTIYGGPVGKTHEEYVELYTGCSKRLPYHKLVGNPWEVLQVELTEETLGRLLPLAIPLGLPHDHFYAAIVDGMLRKMVRR